MRYHWNPLWFFFAVTNKALVGRRVPLLYTLSVDGEQEQSASTKSAPSTEDAGGSERR